MANKRLIKAVGRRWRKVNVANLATDQYTIIDLLSSIPNEQGGRQTTWIVPPAPGPDGACPQILADAIWNFQKHWWNQGVFHAIDGVVEPGKNTLRKMNELAPDTPLQARPNGYVSRTHEGAPHGHSLCPRPGPGKSIVSHIATPINPQHTERMINIGGEGETDYLGFEDYVPDPDLDDDMREFWVNGRPFTTTIKSNTVSDICFRSTILDTYMQCKELPRICKVGCRLTYANSWDKIVKLLPYFREIGPIIDHEIIYQPEFEDKRGSWHGALHVPVVIMLHHKKFLKNPPPMCPENEK